MNPHTALLKRYRRVQPVAANQDYFLRQGILKLLAVKDSDIRLLTLEQCRDAVDKSLHAGGAFSATIPLVALYYGGFLEVVFRLLLVKKNSFARIQLAEKDML